MLSTKLSQVYQSKLLTVKDRLFNIDYLQMTWYGCSKAVNELVIYSSYLDLTPTLRLWHLLALWQGGIIVRKVI